MVALALVTLGPAIVLGKAVGTPAQMHDMIVNIATEGKKMVMRMPPNPDGSFFAFLDPGVYRMRLAPRKGTAGGGPLRQITITAGVINRVFIPGTAPAAGVGRVEGYIEAGPLSPVEKVGEVKVPPPGMFKGCTVTFAGGVTKKVSAAVHGMFSIDLKPGDYTVTTDFKSPRPAEPVKISVKAGSLTKATIRVDTGIR